MAICSLFYFNCYCHHFSFVVKMGMGRKISYIVGRAWLRGTHWIYLFMALEHFCWSSAWKRRILMSHNPGALTMLEQWVCLIIWSYFNLLKCNGPTWGCCPDPTKSILIVHPNNLKAGELFGAHHGFMVCIGAPYIRGYIGDDKSKRDCLKKWTK